MTANNQTNNISSIYFKNLRLDADNPRLPESLSRDESSIIDYIAKTTSIEDLMSAIAENDFFPGEPLVVVEDEPGIQVVIEGNRRLTAVILLHDPHRCANPSKRMLEIADKAKHKPEHLPTVLRTREDALPYLGFRHITGVQQWEPLAKARYLHKVYELFSDESDFKARYYRVAQTIGSRSDYVKRSLDALAVYRVIENEDFFGIDQLDESSIKFAVLSTALADERIAQFVGINKENNNADTEYLYPISNLDSIRVDSIKLLTEWLYKRDDKGETKVGESRNLRKLSAVVANEKALKALKEGARLEVAYELTTDNTKDFIDLLYQAEANLSQAASMVATVDYDADAYETTKDLRSLITLIGKNLKEKRDGEDDDF